MEYTFGDSKKGGDLVLGLHRQNRFYEIVDTIACNVIDDDFNKIRIAVQDYFREKKASFYHKSRKEGLLRHFIIRKAFRTNEIMLIHLHIRILYFQFHLFLHFLLLFRLLLLLFLYL